MADCYYFIFGLAIAIQGESEVVPHSGGDHWACELPKCCLASVPLHRSSADVAHEVSNPDTNVYPMYGISPVHDMLPAL